MAAQQCPSCSDSAIPVVWGKPGADTLTAAERGLVRAGGCIVRGTPDATWWCPKCEASFAGPATKPAIVAARAAVAGGASGGGDR